MTACEYVAAWRRVRFLPGGHESAGCCSFQTVAYEMKSHPASPHKTAGLYHWMSSMDQRSCGLRLINEEFEYNRMRVTTFQVLLKPNSAGLSQVCEVNHNDKFPP